MKAPSYTIAANRIDGDDISHQCSPSWCVVFIRYAEPAAMYEDPSKGAIKKIMYVENDCISVSIDNAKSSFGKTCSMALKAGDVYYLNAVAPGDWVFVWMNNYQDDIDRVIKGLNDLTGFGQSGVLNNWNSGLKFVGRVLDVRSNDTVSDSGVRTIVQTVSAQSFLEFATSVYYTDLARNFFTQTLDPQPGKTAPDLSLPLLATNGLTAALGNLSGKFTSFFSSDGSFYSYPPPDRAIAFYLVIAMGMQKGKLEELFATKDYTVEGVISDAITVPQDVSRILGKPGVTKLWELMNIFLGLQQYSNLNAGSAWARFAPQTKDLASNESGSNPVFFVSPISLKGWIPFFPTPWDNKSLWDILNEYLNPIVNEMYTVLRVDRHNRIRPTLVVREQPFSTPLYSALSTTPLVQIIPKGQTKEQVLDRFEATRKDELDKALQRVQDQKDKTQVPKTDIDQKNVVRTQYANIPRWIIDESMIRSVNLYTTERNRINFVQVWGSNQYLDIAPPPKPGSPSTNSVETSKSLQMLAGNMVQDTDDIQRNGLRANIQDSPFDYPVPYLSFTKTWARMRADWLFHGHLKALGTVVLNGIAEPICEGDNAQFRGMVFHIERVSHKGSISASGVKSFTTELILSNGITADSLDNDQLPQYMVHQTHSANSYPYMPGTTDIQYTSHSNRDANGELTREQGDE